MRRSEPFNVVGRLYPGSWLCPPISMDMFLAVSDGTIISWVPNTMYQLTHLKYVMIVG